MAVHLFQTNNQANNQIPVGDIRPLQTKLLPNNSLDQVTLHGSLQKFFTNYQAQARCFRFRSARTIVEHEQFAANSSPETKNG